MSTVRVEELARATALGVLVGAVALSLATVMGRFAPGAHALPIAACCGISAAAAAVSRRRLARPGWRIKALQAAGLAVVLVAFLAGAADPLVGRGGGALPFSSLVILSWPVGRSLSHDLALFDRTPIYGAGNASLGRFVRRFVLGAILIWILGIAWSGESSLTAFALPLYLVLGIAVAIQVRYAEFRQRWREQNLVVVAGLAGCWLQYTLGLLAVAAAVVVLVPSSAESAAVGALRGGLMSVAGLLAPALIRLLGITHYGVYFPSVCRGGVCGGELPRGNVRPSLAHHHHLHAGHGGHPSLVLPWLVAIVLLGYGVYAYSRHRTEGISFWAALLRPLASALRLARGMLHRSLDRIAGAVPLRFLSALPGAPLLARVVLPFGSADRSLRGQLLRHYLSVVRSGQRYGLSRRQSQTPWEYEALLTTRLEDARQDLDLLTDAFVEARYSSREVPASTVRDVRLACQRVRAALKAANRERGPHL